MSSIWCYLDIENSTISGNEAEEGGGIVIWPDYTGSGYAHADTMALSHECKHCYTE